MVIKNRGNRLPVEAWETESLRLTAFLTSLSPMEKVDWWERLMNEPPEEEVVRRREGERTIEGAFENGRLVIKTSPPRVDWHLLPSRTQEATNAGFLTIGKFVSIIGPFTQVMIRWLNLDSCPTIQRIAFGAVLLCPMDNRASGYRQLAAYLPSINIDPINSSDFLYNINRPRVAKTEISNLTINRLSKWSVAAMSTSSFVIKPTHMLFPEVSQEYFACRLEVDINTDARRREPLPRGAVSNIWEELTDLGRELIIEGDIP